MADNDEFRFDRRLLDRIKYYRHYKARMMLNEELAKKSDGFGTLLHRAAFYDSEEIVEQLIKLGSDVNSSGPGGKTPLMLAIENECLGPVRVLLKNGASITDTDDNGRSSLQMVFHPDYLDTRIVEVFVRKFNDEEIDLVLLAEKLVGCGCALYRVTCLNNVHLIRHMLQLESQMEEKEPQNTVQQVVALLCWNLFDEKIDRPSASFCLYQNKLVNIVAVHPSVEPQLKQHLLSQLGNNNLVLLEPINDSAFRRVASSARELVEHLAMQKKIDEPVFLGINCYRATWDAEQITIDNTYEKCQQMLDAKFSRELTLLHLLTYNNSLMRVFVRDAEFAPSIEMACFLYDLSMTFPHYFKTLMLRILRAKEDLRKYPDEE